MSFPKVGVIGGGQLARMMQPAAIALGVQLSVLSETEGSPAQQVIPQAPVGDYKDFAAVEQFARTVDVVTFDHEHVPLEHIQALEAQGIKVYPGSKALAHAQNKITLRTAIDRLGLSNPAWAQVQTAEHIVDFGGQYGWPVVLKTPVGGYDGKGVRVLKDADEAGQNDDWFTAAAGSPLLVEEFIPFTRELAAQVSRTPSGELVAWPVVETIQVDGVCHTVTAPAPGLSTEQARHATDIARAVATELDVVGDLTVELFDVSGVAKFADNPDHPGVVVNELAMRPHNSGHWSIEGSVTSQFEQHLRAVLDVPLGATEPLAPFAVMVNLLGGPRSDHYAAYPEVAQRFPQVKLHDYGKSVRPGRKLGHVTVLGEDSAALKQTGQKVSDFITGRSVSLD